MVILILVRGRGRNLRGGKQAIVGIVVITRNSVVAIVTWLRAGCPKYPGSILSVSMEKLERTTIRPLETIEPLFFSFPVRIPVSVMTELSVLLPSSETQKH